VNKAENLNLIHEQLQAPEVLNVLTFLEANKSTYNVPFSKLRKELHQARLEANDNTRYLKGLQKYVDILENSGRDFTTLHEIFVPMMHTIMLIWNNSKFYNTPTRLVVLLREISNALIA